jgi:hypothetical protein
MGSFSYRREGAGRQEAEAGGRRPYNPRYVDVLPIGGAELCLGMGRVKLEEQEFGVWSLEFRV